jgi:hypothetical protein
MTKHAAGLKDTGLILKVPTGLLLTPYASGSEQHSVWNLINNPIRKKWTADLSAVLLSQGKATAYIYCTRKFSIFIVRRSDVHGYRRWFLLENVEIENKYPMISSSFQVFDSKYSR